MSSPRSVDPAGEGAAVLRLSRPVRLIWRPFLAGDPPPAGDRVGAIAGAIADAAPLVVEVWLPAPWPELPSFPSARVSVVAPPSTLASVPTGVVHVADLTPYDGTVPPLRADHGAAAAAFLLSRRTAPLLSRAAEGAVSAGVGTMALPPLPFHLFGALGTPLGSPGELDGVLRGVIQPALPSLRGIRWEVHDRFLLERLRGIGLEVGEPPADAGCQAGTALAYVGPGGALFPCPIWEVPFGTLDGAWDPLWQGEARRAFLEGFPRHDACPGCVRRDRCAGGCPGAAAALGLAGVPDPLCPEVPRG